MQEDEKRREKYGKKKRMKYGKKKKEKYGKKKEKKYEIFTSGVSCIILPSTLGSSLQAAASSWGFLKSNTCIRNWEDYLTFI